MFKSLSINVLLVLSVFFAGLIPGEAQTLLQNVEGREITSLNGRWNFIIDPYQMGYLDYRLKPFDESESGKGGFYDNRTDPITDKLVEYNFDMDQTMAVPGDWNSQDERLQFYEGTVWYKKDFDLQVKEGKRYFIDFAAVNYQTNVYLNGKKLGSNKGGFTPFQFEVTEGVKNGKNFVVVMVDNTRKKDEIPTVNTDWWNYGGITRDVTLIEAPQNFIRDYKVQLGKGDMNMIDGYVQLAETDRSETVTIDIPELKINKTFTTDGSGKVKFQIPVKQIKHWSPESPVLYTVNISSEGDKISDKIGFRKIHTEGKNIYLNNKSVFLKGISIHDENPLIEGRLRSEGDMRMMLKWAKDLGCNYVRLAHYTHSETMLRLADEMGLMVWSEVPVYWTISWENEETYANAENQLSTSIERDKNRASVVIWSVGNETPITEPRNVFMGKLVDKVKSLDDTRLVSAALEIERKNNIITVEDKLGDKLDIVSFNEYGGWYWGKAKDLPKYDFDIKFNKPIIISEFGGGALGGYHGSEDTIFTEEYQESLYIYQLEMLEKIDGLRGMTPWILVDFKSPRRQHPVYQNFWNRKGLLTPTGAKKKAYYVLQDYYKNKTLEYASKGKMSHLKQQ